MVLAPGGAPGRADGAQDLLAAAVRGGGVPKSGQPIITYVLENAWPSKLEISGMKAGATEVVTETVVLLCDQILMQPAG